MAAQKERKEEALEPQECIDILNLTIDCISLQDRITKLNQKTLLQAYIPIPLDFMVTRQEPPLACGICKAVFQDPGIINCTKTLAIPLS